jgi:hypothetical protein
VNPRQHRFLRLPMRVAQGPFRARSMPRLAAIVAFPRPLFRDRFPELPEDEGGAAM